MSIVRSAFRLVLRQALVGRCRRALGVENIHNVLIASPHYDDEVLGCGGTLSWLASRGVNVRLAFMTDGSGSHRHLMDPEKLSEMRREEAVAAARIMGGDDSLFFFGIPDGKLQQHVEEGTIRLAEVLDRSGTQMLFIPSVLDIQSDHLATRIIALSALRRLRRKCMAVEYVVWGWYRWPWCRVDTPGRLAIPGMLLRSLMDDLRMLAYLNTVVDVRPWLETKRRALDAHRTQTQRIVPHPGWVTLADVGKGEWIDNFFQPHEFFHVSENLPFLQ